MIANELANFTKIPLAEIVYKRFSDGESYTRILTDISGKRTFIVQGSHPPQDSNLQQLYQLVESACNMGASEVNCVVPYLAYARQDRRVLSGEPISVLIILKTLEMLGVKRLMTIEVHNPDVFKYTGMESISISTAFSFGQYFSAMNMKNPLVISPDEGGAKRAFEVSKVVNSEYGYYKKTKESGDVNVKPTFNSQYIDVKNKDIIIIDDITSSGSTILPLIKKVNGEGARRCFVGITHFFANAEVLNKMEELGAIVVSTDSIKTKSSKIHLAPLIGDIIVKNTSRE